MTQPSCPCTDHFRIAIQELYASPIDHWWHTANELEVCFEVVILQQA